MVQYDYRIAWKDKLRPCNIIKVDLFFMFYHVVLFTPCVKSILGTSQSRAE
jgi:hypothetical protein